MSKQFRALGAAVMVASCSLAASPAAFADGSLQFDLPAQALEESLRAIGKSTGINILIDRELVRDHGAPALGTFDLFGRSHRYTVGADYSEIDGGGQKGRRMVGYDYPGPAVDVFAPFDPSQFPAPTLEVTGVYPENGQKQNGFYGTFGLQLAEPLRLTLGGRYGEYEYEQIYRSVEARRLRSGVASRESQSDAQREHASSMEARLLELEKRHEQLKLVTLALWRLLKDRSELSESNLKKYVESTDLLDGSADGKVDLVKGLIKCPDCEHYLLNTAIVCPYCGASNTAANAFDIA